MELILSLALIVFGLAMLLRQRQRRAAPTAPPPKDRQIFAADNLEVRAANIAFALGSKSLEDAELIAAALHAYAKLDQPDVVTTQPKLTLLPGGRK